jgi:hypothetical protein
MTSPIFSLPIGERWLDVRLLPLDGNPFELPLRSLQSLQHLKCGQSCPVCEELRRQRLFKYTETCNAVKQAWQRWLRRLS